MKKEYSQPSLEVTELLTEDILAGSDEKDVLFDGGASGDLPSLWS